LLKLEKVTAMSFTFKTDDSWEESEGMVFPLLKNWLKKMAIYQKQQKDWRVAVTHVFTLPLLDPVSWFCFMNILSKYCAWLWRKGGILSPTPFSLSKSSILKPLSAITESPRSSKSRIPLHLLISLSEIDPVCNEEISETAPCGVISINPFSVVLLL